jgi:hypothetical protein
MSEATENAEWRRLAAATSLTDAFAGHVDDLTTLPVDDIPWLSGLSVPPDWQLALSPDRRLRVAVYGRVPRGGWQACQTIAMFGFTGAIGAREVVDNAERMLGDLGAARVRSHTPALPGVAAARSSGRFAVAGRSMWARFATYAVGSADPGQGRLVAHSAFVDADSYFQMGADVGALTTAIESAVVVMAGTVPNPTSGPRINH